jgi:hypothetical protein
VPAVTGPSPKTGQPPPPITTGGKPANASAAGPEPRG